MSAGSAVIAPEYLSELYFDRIFNYFRFMNHNNSSLYDQAPYRQSDKLRDLIDDNSMMLTVIGRFDISLGFHDSSILEVCRAHDVDCPTFLAVANFISGRRYDCDKIGRAPMLSEKGSE